MVIEKKLQQHLLVAAATVDPSPAFQSRGSSRIVVLVAAATVDTDLQNQPSLPRLADGCADVPGFENMSLPKHLHKARMLYPSPRTRAAE
jgi:hypothetical protein